MFYKTLLFTGLFHSISYFIVLSIIFLAIIINTEHKGIFLNIKHIIEKNIINTLSNNKDLCNQYINYRKYIKNLIHPLEYNSQQYNFKLILILILVIIILIIIIIFFFKYLNIYNLLYFKWYIIDLLLIVVGLGLIEFLFFILVASKYVSLN